MCKVADHENHVRWIYLTTVLNMGEGQKYARNINNETMYLQNMRNKCLSQLLKHNAANERNICLYIIRC